MMTVVLPGQSERRTCAHTLLHVPNAAVALLTSRCQVPSDSLQKKKPFNRSRLIALQDYNMGRSWTCIEASSSSSNITPEPVSQRKLRSDFVVRHWKDILSSNERPSTISVLHQSLLTRSNLAHSV